MPRPIPRHAVLFALFAVALATPHLQAQDQDDDDAPEAQPAQPSAPDPRIIAQSGRDTRVWPPDPLFNHLHMKLELTIPSMDEPRFSARQTLTISPISKPRSEITLDAGAGLTFSSITLDGRPAPFSHEGSFLTISFPAPVSPGARATLVIDYTADRPGGRGAGLTFSKDDKDTPEHDPMLHSQGQAESNHLWFPCHDFPNLRVPTELIATVPAGFKALSNGRLLSVSHSRSFTTYHWRQELPHPYYLVSLVVGKFEIIDLGGPGSARPGLWMPLYCPPGSADHVRETFANTAAMVRYFEELFDEPYPWEKYAQSFARDFAAGAMENTSASTFGQFAARLGRNGVEPIIAHELVHQWLGNYITCRSWEHLWLNEGWATFGEALWAGHIRGERGYQRSIARNLGQVRASARGTAPRREAMVSNRYTDPDNRFTGSENVYSKGAVILHMLRTRLGDDTFFAATRLYIDRFKLQQVTTDDFRRVFEEVSGDSLERFFDQWARRPGIPRLAVDLDWNESDSSLTVSIEQTQTIDADNPAFAFSLPILIDFTPTPDGDEPSPAPPHPARTVYLDCDTTTASITVSLPARPSKVVIDPDLTVLSQHRIRQPLAHAFDWWTNQLHTGPTDFARLQAADALAALGDPRALPHLLRAAAQDDSADDPAIAIAATRASLGIIAAGTRRSAAALASSSFMDQPRPRRSLTAR